MVLLPRTAGRASLLALAAVAAVVLSGCAARPAEHQRESRPAEHVTSTPTHRPVGRTTTPAAPSAGSQPVGRTTPTAPSTATAPSQTATRGKATQPASPTQVSRTVEPGGGLRLFPGHRIVAFYGAAGNPTLGALGDAPPGKLWARLSAQAAKYDRHGVHTVPAYELIAYVARGSPGASGNYTARTPDATIKTYLKVVKAHHGMLILDIQPGRSSFLADAKTLAPYLTDRHVGLALDPEWKLPPGGRFPYQQFGHTTAGAVNAVSSWMAHLTRAHHLPQKLLLVHQFQAHMVRDKKAVRTRRHVAVTFNMDGFGSQAAKLSTYKIIADDHRFPLGFKLFYQQDVDMLSPAQVLRCKPAPHVIEYE
jgi:hypothetical protein